VGAFQRNGKNCIPDTELLFPSELKGEWTFSTRSCKTEHVYTCTYVYICGDTGGMASWCLPPPCLPFFTL